MTTKPVGTGPFSFVSYDANQQFTLKAFADYYEKGQPYLDEVVFRFFKDQASIASALRSKAIDMTWFKDPKVSAQIARTSRDLVSAPGKTTRTFPVWMNLKSGPTRGCAGAPRPQPCHRPQGLPRDGARRLRQGRGHGAGKPCRRL